MQFVEVPHGSAVVRRKASALMTRLIRKGTWPSASMMTAFALPTLLLLPFDFVGFTTTDVWPLIRSSQIREPLDLIRLFSEPLGAGTAFLTEVGRHYRPIVALSFGLDYSLWGMNSFGYHLTNHLLHIAAVVGLFSLSQLMGMPRWAGLFACLLFTVHPAVLATVPGLARRQDILALAFGLAALVALVRQRRVLAASLFLVACLSKESALALIPVVPYLLHRRADKTGHSLTAQAAVSEMLILAAPGGLVVLARVLVLGGLAGYGTAELPTLNAVDVYRATLIRYLADLLWFMPAMDPGFGVSVIQHAGLVSLISCLTAAVASSRWRWLMAAGAVWVLSFATLYTLLRVMAPWNLYAPIAGFSLLLATAATALIERLRNPLSARPGWTVALTAACLAGTLAMSYFLVKADTLWEAHKDWSSVGASTATYLGGLTSCISSIPEQEPVVLLYELPLTPESARGRNNRVFEATGLLTFSVQSYLDLRAGPELVTVIRGDDQAFVRHRASGCTLDNGKWHFWTTRDGRT